VVLVGLVLFLGNPITNATFSSLPKESRVAEQVFELVQWALSPFAAVALAALLGVIGIGLSFLGFRARQRLLSAVGVTLNLALILVGAALWFLLTHGD